MAERLAVVIRPVADAGTTAYRLEHPDGRHTGSGLFVSPDWARKYANQHGWQVAKEDSDD
jgi:hypothetical protein